MVCFEYASHSKGRIASMKLRGVGKLVAGGGDVLATAATYLGMSVADLRTELQSGKSLADVAVEKGKTRDGLIAALTQAEQMRIAQLVDQKGLGSKLPGGPG